MLARTLPLAVHWIVNQVPIALTLSLNVMVMLLSSGTLAAPFAGLTLLTWGALFAPEQGERANVPFRGVGAPAEKSVPFWFVSVQPAPARRAAVVFVNAGAVALPSKKLAVP